MSARISTQAEAARESARQPSGKFGSYSAEQSQATLAPPATTDESEALEAAQQNFDETIQWYREVHGDHYPFTQRGNVHPGEAQGRLDEAAAELGSTESGREILAEYRNENALAHQASRGGHVSKAILRASNEGTDQGIEREFEAGGDYQPLGDHRLAAGDAVYSRDRLAHATREYTATGQQQGRYLGVRDAAGIEFSHSREELLVRSDHATTRTDQASP